jgi:hypothetical protein
MCGVHEHVYMFVCIHCKRTINHAAMVRVSRARSTAKAAVRGVHQRERERKRELAAVTQFNLQTASSCYTTLLK